MTRFPLFALALALAVPSSAQQLYYTDGSGVASVVGRSDLDGGNQVTLVPSGLNAADGIRLDAAGGKLYWAEQSGAIKRADVDGTDVETIVNIPGANPHAVALDLGASKVYWTELNNNRIRRSNLDGTGVELVISANAADGLAIDPGGAKIYWSRGNVIRRANTDGTGNELLYTTNVPHGIALDVASGKIYWTTLGSGRIQRGDMDGSGVIEDLVLGQATPVDISLDLGAGKMYWTELGGGGNIKRANLDGTGVETILGSEVSGPFGVVVDPASVASVPVMPTLGRALAGVLLLGTGLVLLRRRPVRVS